MIIMIRRMDMYPSAHAYIAHNSVCDRRGAAQFMKTARSVLTIIISVHRVMQCIIKIDMKGKEVVGDECTYKSRSCTIIV